jgi:hypothetical protein
MNALAQRPDWEHSPQKQKSAGTLRPMQTIKAVYVLFWIKVIFFDRTVPNQAVLNT